MSGRADIPSALINVIHADRDRGGELSAGGSEISMGTLNEVMSSFNGKVRNESRVLQEGV